MIIDDPNVVGAPYLFEILQMDKQREAMRINENSENEYNRKKRDVKSIINIQMDDIKKAMKNVQALDSESEIALELQKLKEIREHEIEDGGLNVNNNTQAARVPTSEDNFEQESSEESNKDENSQFEVEPEVVRLHPDDFQSNSFKQSEEDAALGLMNSGFMDQNMNGARFKRNIDDEEENNDNLLNEKDDFHNRQEEITKQADELLGKILENDQKFKDTNLDKAREATDENLGKLLNSQIEFTNNKDLSEEKIKELMAKQEKIMKTLRLNENDGDLMMIGDIGGNILEDLTESKSNTKARMSKFY